MIIFKLELLMKNRNLSQRELSKLTGIRQPSISAYCNDTYTMIPKEHISILCEFFNCQVGDLIEFVNEDKE